MYEDAEDGFRLECSEDHGPALLRSEYAQKKLTVETRLEGLFRYKQWLPIRRILDSPVKPAVFKSQTLAERIGLENLWFAFNGYWPERNGVMETCSFKELEAHPVCARLPDGADGVLVVASAGNTGRAFLQTCSKYGIPALIVVPDSAAAEMWVTVDRHPEVKLAVLQGGGDYLDAIELASKIAALDGYFPEGGAKNVARRDGMGTVVLAAVEEIGRLPDHYFQAIGSGTGGIASWEMSRRLLQDGRYGSDQMKLHLVQNQPFALMSDAWNAGSPQLPSLDEREAKSRISRLHSRVLSNRKPPYSIAGGVYDALKDTAGQMYSVTSEEALLAGWLFESLEGCDLDPAAEVALAGLVRAVRQGCINSSDVVLLNLTGGGRKRLELEDGICSVQPDYVFSSNELSLSELEAQLLRTPLRSSV
jgi:cysteate synthase